MDLLLENSSAIWLTFKLAAYTVIILLFLGLPLAWWLSRYQGILKPIFEALIALPLVLPPTVLGFYLLMAFAPGSPMGDAWISLIGSQLVFSFNGILFGSLIYSLPFVIQPLLSAFTQLGQKLDMAASTLGIPPLKRFIFVVLPVLRPSIISAATLGFAHTLGEFGLVLMIGGNIPNETQVLSIELYNQVEMMNYDFAHQLAMFLLLLSLVSLTLLYRFNRNAKPFGL